jgi:hypothetical protein
MKTIFLTTLVVFTFFLGYAQEETDSIKKQHAFNKLLSHLSGSFESNIQWYNDDKQLGDFFEDVKDPEGKDHLRANSYLKLDYKILNNLTTGIQIESYSPISLLNYSPKFDKDIGLAQYYVNYKNEKIDATVGYFYEQYGSGLILRAWEDRALGINNSLRGAKLNYTPTASISISGFWGQPRDGFDVTDSELFGANTEFDLSTLLKLEKIPILNVGFSYVGKKESYESLTVNNVPELVNSFSGRIDVDFGKIYSSFEYVSKAKDARLNDAVNVVEEKLFSGNAVLWTLGYTKKGFGISNTFRRLEGMNFYSERLSASSSNLYAENLVNYLPGLTKQHDYTLTNLYVYQAQPGLNVIVDKLSAGEIGTQLDLYYKIKKGSTLGGKYGTKLSFNMSYWAGLNTKVTDPNFDPNSLFNSLSNDTDYESDFINFKNKYFRDINLEVRKKWTPKLSSIFSYVNINISKDLATGRPIGTSNKFIQSNVLVVESTYKLKKGKSARLELQYLWNKKATDNNHYDEDRKDWIGGTFEYNFSSKVGFYANDSYNFGNDIKDDRIHYYNLGGSYTKGNTRIALNYGKQRGGLLCVGGVCRIVSPNTGFTINLTTSF